MSKLAQLRELRNVKAREAQDLNAKHPADQRMPTNDAARLDELLASIEQIDDDIGREMRIAKLALEESGNALDRAREVATRDPSKHGETSAEIKAFLLGGIANLSPAQRERHSARVTPDIRAAMSTTTTTEGGFTVSTEYMRGLEHAQKAYGGMLQVATVMNTASGATMNFPTGDHTAEVGEIIGQNTTVTRQDTSFGNVSVDVYKYSSKDIAAPFELLQDTFIDMEAYLQEVLSMRLGRILNTHATVGTGSGQPRGVVTAAALGRTGTTGQTTTVTYDDLVELEHSVDPAYRELPGVAYMMHDSSLKVIRKIKDSNGRPIFVPGYEQGNPGGAPDRLLGRRIVINQDVAVMAANAKSILFGAFSKYRVRRVMDLTFFRMTDSAFTRNGQVGFLAFQRMGGNLVDVSGSTVKYYANSAT